MSGRGSRPRCPACGSEGSVAHAAVPDHFFGTAGTWSYRACRDAHCGLAWIDPLPSEDELRAAYASYYTHAAPRRKAPLLRPVYERMKRGYLARRLGYTDGVGDLARWLGLFASLLPEGRHQMEAASMHLPAAERGRMLEIGCGNGNVLGQLAALGWEAWGVDLDPRAVEEARKSGAADVRAGTLEEQAYPDAHFDAVASVHAVEHVPDPRALFRECHRVLRAGGHLVVSTPNWRCLTHRTFGGHWRGLEAPRHLHVFSRRSLRRMLAAEGFELERLETNARGAAHGYAQSHRARSETTPAWLRSALAHVHSVRVQGRTSIDPDAGDELLAVARKPGGLTPRAAAP